MQRVYSTGNGLQLLALLALCVASGLSAYRLDPRRRLTPRDIRLRCCSNRWSECCKVFPWEDADREREKGEGEGSASGSGSGDLDMQFTPECAKYNTIYVNNTNGDKCVNNYVLFRDVRTVRNIIALLHKCASRKDQVFHDELMRVDGDVRAGGDRCCGKHAREGATFEVAYLVRVTTIRKDLEMLEKDFKLHNSLASIPCYLYGHSVTIEDKMMEAIWEMGLYIHCAAEGACE